VKIPCKFTIVLLDPVEDNDAKFILELKDGTFCKVHVLKPTLIDIADFVEDL
jgi:hypothetical protein